MFNLTHNSKKKWLASFALITSVAAVAATVTFTDDFLSDASIDTSKTTANLSTAKQALYLAWSKQQQHRLPDGDTTGTAIGSESDSTRSIAFGDIDSDGDLDLVVGNWGETNKLYLNDGSGGFTTGTAIGSEFDSSISIALGDIDGDGDLDLVTGNDNGTNKLYLYDSSTSSFAATGTAIGNLADTWSIALGDIDGDGHLDLVAGNYGQINKLYLNDGSGGFTTGTNIGSELGPTLSIVLGDIDGDGDLDVVTGTKFYLNDGSGGFDATGTAIGSDSNSTWAIALGDIDGDGDLDFVAGNENKTNKFYLNDGSGVFDATGTAIGSELDFTIFIALSDIDGDGDLDLMAGNESATNKLYLNDGSGGFDATGTVIGSDSDNTYSIAFGDIDSDGDLDVVAGNYRVINKLYLNAGSSGFDATGAGIGSELDNTWSIALGDVDGDGDLDVVVGNSNQTNKLYLNDGSGGFTTGAGTDIGSESDNTLSIALGDVDGDGDLDVVVGNVSATNKLYLNDGSGGFTTGAGAAIGSESDDTYAIALGDVDGDGDLDVVAGNNGTNKLYLNDGSGGFTTGAGTAISSDSDTTYTIALGDIDDDGDLDVVAGNTGVNKFYLNDGSGGFTTGAGTAIGSGSNDAYAIALGDIDGDGDLDVVAGNTGVNKLYLNDGSGGFDSTGTVIGSDSDNTYAIVLGDIDSDGDLDVVAGNYNATNKLYLNDGSGGFTTGAGTDIGSESDTTLSIALGDTDSDGDLDVVVGNNGNNKLYLAKTRGVFPSTGTSIDSDADYTLNIVFADIDRDGDLDALVGNYSDVNKLYRNNGDGVFASSGVDIGSDSALTYQIAVGDVDNDGDLDVVSGNNGNNILYLNNAGVFDSGANIDSDGDDTRAITLTDVNGDGNLDVVTGNVNQVDKVYLNNGSGGFNTGVAFSGVTDTYSVAIGDVDNDGDLDIVSGISASTSKYYLNNGDGTFVTGVDIGSGSNLTREIALADMDGNGYLDLVVVNHNQNNEVYLNTTVVATSVTFDAGNDIGNETDSTVSLDITDVDADGDLDVVAGNRGQTNKLYLNDGSGVFPSTGVAIGTETDESYAIAAADVDGDGNIDIMAGNTSSTSGNKLYKQVYYNTHANQVYSNKVNGSVTEIVDVTLTATATTNTATTRNTSIDYYVSNNGGDKWYSVKSGTEFTFPETGTDDIRWRAQLNSLSATITPVLSNVELSYTTLPKITGATYDVLVGKLTVTGINFASKTGAANDIDASMFTFTGETSGSYTLADSVGVDISSLTEFTVTLSATDRAAVNALINKNGTTSTDATVYNLAAAEDWNAGAKTSLIIADSTTPITASNVNEAPTISGAPAVTVAEDASYSFIPTVTDVNTGDTKTFSIANQPSWASFSTTTGELSGTPDNNGVGTTTGIVITVTDSGGLAANLTAFDIAVTNTNDAPTITGTPTTTAVQGVSYSFTPTAADVDSGDTKTFSIANQPSWAGFSTTTGELSGTPTNSNVGTSSNAIVITVTDSAGANASLPAFTITVTNTNDAPTITGTPATTAAQGVSYSFTPTVTDIDSGDTQIFSITNKPEWATFSTTTGALTGTPDEDAVGTTTGIVITVTDSGGLSASLAAFDITVTASSETPTTPTAIKDVSVSVVMTSFSNTSYEMSYEITLTNTGTLAAENVQVTTTIPDGVVLSVIPDNCELVGSLLTCTIASVAPGETVTITLALVGSDNVDGAIVTGIVGADANSATGNVSTTFDSVFKEVTVEAKSSGGSMPIMGLFGCLILLLIRKVKLTSTATPAPMKKLMAAFLVLFATGAQAAEAQSEELQAQSIQMSDLTINVSLGSASSEVSNKSAEQGLANNSQEQNGISTDGSRFAYHAEVGYQIYSDWRVLAGYMDLGPATFTFNGVTSSVDDLVDALSELDKVSGKGLTASVEYTYQYKGANNYNLENWYLAPQVGLFSWSGEIGIDVGDESHTFKESDTSLLYGLTLGYQFNDKASLGLRWLKTSVEQDVNTLMLSVSYRL